MADHTGRQTRSGKGQYVRTLEGAERDAEACRLRAAGQTYQQIADQLYQGDKSNAHRGVARALREAVQEPADELRALELERLDGLIRAAQSVLDRQHVMVSHGRIITQDGQPLEDDGPVLAAIDRLLKLSESRRKLLGLDAPAALQVDGKVVSYRVDGVDMGKLT